MPIFAKLVFDEQPFLKKFCTEVHENLADGLVADYYLRRRRTDVVCT